MARNYNKENQMNGINLTYCPIQPDFQFLTASASRRALLDNGWALPVHIPGSHHKSIKSHLNLHLKYIWLKAIVLVLVNCKSWEFNGYSNLITVK